MIENPKNLVDRLQNAFLSVAADVKSLTASLAGKAKVNHTHTQGQISGLSTALSAKLDKTATAAAATKAAQDGDGNVISSTYLKLSGGEMTGEISLAGTLFSRDSSVPILKNVNNGAKFFLFNPDDAEYKGAFICRAKWSSGRLIDLIGKGDGSLMWDNKHIVRSVNGAVADEAGNVTITAGGVKLKRW